MWSDGFNGDEWNDDPRRQTSKANIVNTCGSTAQTTIAQLSPNIFGSIVTGIVIAKEEPRSFPNKKDPSIERNLLSFTLRDSAVDFINATCWGNKQFIANLAQLFHIGDVVEISNPTIQSKPLDGSDEKFRPWTSSSYQLNVSESRGAVQLHGGWNCSQYNKLFHIPVKVSNDFYTIEDINANGQHLNGESLSMLAVIRNVGSMKQVTTKLGKQKQRCEVKLFDETATNFTLVLWDEESINFAQTWVAKEHVVFAADVRVTYDSFRKSMLATATSKTVFTVNPDTREAHSLYKYAQSADISECQADFQPDIDLSEIKDVYVIDDLKHQCAANATVCNGGALYCIVFGFISALNLDADISNVLAVRCGTCRWRVDRVTGQCGNQTCVNAAANHAADTQITFDLRLSISDHSATLDGCQLSGDAAEKTLGCSVADFMSYDENRKTNLKWTRLLERSKIYLKVTLPTFERQKPTFRILCCDLINMEDIQS